MADHYYRYPWQAYDPYYYYYDDHDEDEDDTVGRSSERPLFVHSAALRAQIDAAALAGVDLALNFVLFVKGDEAELRERFEALIRDNPDRALFDAVREFKVVLAQYEGRRVLTADERERARRWIHAHPYTHLGDVVPQLNLLLRSVNQTRIPSGDRPLLAATLRSTSDFPTQRAPLQPTASPYYSSFPPRSSSETDYYRGVWARFGRPGPAAAN